MPSGGPVQCWQVYASGLGVTVKIYGRDEQDVAAGIWSRFRLLDGQQVRLELDSKTFKMTGRGWILRANKSVQSPLKLTQRRN